jgi:hypothetical protein
VIPVGTSVATTAITLILTGTVTAMKATATPILMPIATLNLVIGATGDLSMAFWQAHIALARRLRLKAQQWIYSF